MSSWNFTYNKFIHKISRDVQESLSSQNKTIDRIIETNTVKKETIDKIPSKSWFIGVYSFSREYLEKAWNKYMKGE